MGDYSGSGKDFLGSGIAFPMGVDKDGNIKMNSFEDHVRQSILLILKTAKEERIMHPDFGSSLNKMTFMAINSALAAVVRNNIEKALIMYEPRIDMIKVGTEIDGEKNNLINITLEYRVRSTDTIHNLVYPFYIERGDV